MNAAHGSGSPGYTPPLGQLSSAYTLPYKYAIRAFGVAAVGLFAAKGFYHALSGDLPAAVNGWVSCAFLLFGVLLVWRWSSPLRSVRVDGSDFVVSDIGREARIPLSSVESLSIVSWCRFMEIRFRAPTPFGIKIRFIPAGTVGSGSNQRLELNRLLDRLTSLIQSAGGRLN